MIAILKIDDVQFINRQDSAIKYLCCIPSSRIKKNLDDLEPIRKLFDENVLFIDGDDPEPSPEPTPPAGDYITPDDTTAYFWKFIKYAVGNNIITLNSYRDLANLIQAQNQLATNNLIYNFGTFNKYFSIPQNINLLDCPIVNVDGIKAYHFRQDFWTWFRCQMNRQNTSFTIRVIFKPVTFPCPLFQARSTSASIESPAGGFRINAINANTLRLRSSETNTSLGSTYDLTLQRVGTFYDLTVSIAPTNTLYTTATVTFKGYTPVTIEKFRFGNLPNILFDTVGAIIENGNTTTGEKYISYFELQENGVSKIILDANKAYNLTQNITNL